MPLVPGPFTPHLPLCSLWGLPTSPQSLPNSPPSLPNSPPSLPTSPPLPSYLTPSLPTSPPLPSYLTPSLPTSPPLPSYLTPLPSYLTPPPFPPFTPLPSSPGDKVLPVFDQFQLPSSRVLVACEAKASPHPPQLQLPECLSDGHLPLSLAQELHQALRVGQNDICHRQDNSKCQLLQGGTSG